MIGNNDKVSLDYEGRLESGEVFDSSKHGDHSHPLEFTVGAGMVIPGFEQAVLGMEKDQEKEFTIESEQAYGSYNDLLKQKVPRNVLPQDQEPKEGMVLIVQTPEGQVPVKIIKVDKETVTIDLNHPLAGKKLIFKIKIVDVQKS